MKNGLELNPGIGLLGFFPSIVQSIMDYFNNSWTLYETLFAGLQGEEPFYRPPVHGLRHPMIFYYGHTACLYINKLRVAGILSKPNNPYFESIFEVGVDEMLWDDMRKNDQIWPTVSEVHEYRKGVYQTIKDVIRHHPSLDGDDVVIDQEHPMWALFMSFEHDRIHLETSSVLIREMPVHLLQKPKHWPPLHPSATRPSSSRTPIQGLDYPMNNLLPVSSDRIVLGKPRDFPSYGWDNEYGKRTVDVPSFYASEHMITNGEFWDFVTSGGYRNDRYWCANGSAWRKHRNMKWPSVWEPVGPQGSHEYALRIIFEVIPMQWDWPVDVNYYEAKAFCRWKNDTSDSPTSQGFRLLTEAEHHLLRHKEHNINAALSNWSSDKVMLSNGLDFSHCDSGAANLNLAFSSQNPVNYFPPSHTGHRDVTGNSWEWTEDHFNPLEGFEVHQVYDDFSTPCFDGKHNMIVGGSFISTGDEASVFARFHFRPHFLQHSGFRLVASDADAPATYLDSNSSSSMEDVTTISGQGSTASDNPYDTDELLNMYLGLHYPLSGVQEGVDPIIHHDHCPSHALRFLQRVAQLLCALKPQKTNGRALDIGCAVGGAAFELTKTFDHVEAFDYSKTFIHAAKQMQKKEIVKFRIPIEADIFEEVQAIHEAGMDESLLNKVNFFNGDACKLDQYAAQQNFGKFDGVLMSNLLCRLPDPVATLLALPKIVNVGGVVVLVTPFTWLEEYTPREKWLGGFYDPHSGDPVFSQICLEEIMQSQGFDKIYDEPMPLVIREHQRKYQYIVSQATGWRRR